MFMKKSKIDNILKQCRVIAENSKCARRKFGASIYSPDGVRISSGYNGSIRGTFNCGEGDGSLPCGKNAHGEAHTTSYEWCSAVHAEVNAVINAARIGVSTVGCILFLEATKDEHRSIPCINCRRVIVNAGIEYVIYKTRKGIIVKNHIRSYITMESIWMQNRYFGERI